jgi:hypothetical protein
MAAGATRTSSCTTTQGPSFSSSTEGSGAAPGLLQAPRVVPPL